MHARTILYASALALMASSAAQANPTALTLRDFRMLVRFGTPHFSPDGTHIAIRTMRPDFVHDRWATTLRVLETRGGGARALVRGMRSLSRVRWLPDGRRIAFIAKVGTEKPQVYVVSAAGGTPKALTDAPRGVEQYSFSPNGRTIAYVTPDKSPLSAAQRRTHHDLFVIHDDDYLIHGPPVASEIWLQSTNGGAARELTFGPGGVLETEPPFGGGIIAPSWSADGQWIVYARQADADDSDSDRATIMAVNVANGAQERIGTHRTNEFTPRFAPSGTTVAYLYPHGPGEVSVMDVYVGSPGGTVRDVTSRLGRNFDTRFAWLPGAQALVGIAHEGVGSGIFLLPLHGAGHALALGGLQARSVAASSQGALAVVADSTTRAPELYLMRTLHSAPLALTQLNRGFTHYAYPVSVAITWHAPDGQINDGILTYPNQYVRGRRYPLVVFSHGGPEDASVEHFDDGEIGPLRLLFAAHGYLVFEPNYRGSDNLGNDHEHAIYRDPGVGPDRDVISGIRLLKSKGIVESNRIAAVGHSYGGYMTAWLIGHQHFWRCAVVADGVTDWTEEYELSGDGNLAWTRDSFGGTPWQKGSAALYRSSSPITYAASITTPTLILSGTADVTVPITESFALYHALASRHIPVKFIGIPGAHHWPQHPVHRALFYRAMLQWVTKYLGH